MPFTCEIVPFNDVTKKYTISRPMKIAKFNDSDVPDDLEVARKWAVKPTTLSPSFGDRYPGIKDLDARPGDTWVVSFAKCGTTWTQEMVWLLDNNLDFEAAKTTPLTNRFHYLELNKLPNGEPGEPIKKLRDMTTKRYIKSHLPAHLLSRSLWYAKSKVIYVARNPKDAAVSFFHHQKNLDGFTGSLDDYLDIFINDYVMFGPFHDHVLDFWRMRDEENVLFITYEEMKRDLEGVIRKTCAFLGKDYPAERIEELKEHLSFKSMRENDKIKIEHFTGIYQDWQDKSYRFVRKGQVGGYKSEMSTEWIEKFNKWSEKELQGSGFKFEE
ncbi:luciferin sulfotransferase-like isoform X1 [Lutzomyia longipalpis]|uniref:luciferin sulfotransferase-like isoform X1 n=1 Tax=Lutzomyia longipalpis TaxID=7200 RepID=UPI0024846BE5|nr:luciferin sulfotransferase-like isoform X1 [Lutzomyia longipalpis]